MVRLATRPIVIGRVVHFRIGQIAHGEGCYSNGLVQVAPLPEEVFGKVSPCAAAGVRRASRRGTCQSVHRPFVHRVTRLFCRSSAAFAFPQALALGPIPIAECEAMLRGHSARGQCASAA